MCENFENSRGEGGGVNLRGNFGKSRGEGGHMANPFRGGGGAGTTHLENHMVGFLSKSPGPNLRNLELLARKKWQKLSKSLACLELAQQ